MMQGTYEHAKKIIKLFGQETLNRILEEYYK